MKIRTAFVDDQLTSLEAFLSFQSDTSEANLKDDVLLMESKQFIIMPASDFSKRTVRSFFHRDSRKTI